MFVWEWGMKAICLRARDGPEALAYDEAQQPRPGEGEVLVRGSRGRRHPYGTLLAPDLDQSGGRAAPIAGYPRTRILREIAALGAGSGMRVWGTWCTDSTTGTGTARPPNTAWRASPISPTSRPAWITFMQPPHRFSALTTWQGLVDRAGLAGGQRVLIHGAAGGVGTFAVQLARWRGARVTATASAANLDFVRSLGADEVIDYRAERFEDLVRHVDVVFDTVGGETLERSWSVLKPGGGWSPSLLQGNGDRRAHSCRVLSSWSLAERSWWRSHG